MKAELGTYLVSNRLRLRDVQDSLQLIHAEVANANVPSRKHMNHIANGIFKQSLLGQITFFEFLHLRPRARNVRLSIARVVDEVQVDVINP